METAANSSAPDFGAIKQRQQATWASGDFGRIGVRLQIVGETLAEAVNLRAGERVLDVAAGNGNAALAAARRFAHVTAVDYVPTLLEQAHRRAEADGLMLVTREADIEELPFADGEFDVALSTYGVMFAPNQERAAAELLRVVKPGGRIGLASWTPEGFIGRLFALMGGFVPPPPGVASPAAWGTEARIDELFRRDTDLLRTERKTFVFRHPSAGHWIEYFRRYYGPVHRAFAALDEPKQQALHQALLELLGTFDRGGGDSLIVPSEYLEAVIHRA